MSQPCGDTVATEHTNFLLFYENAHRHISNTRVDCALITGCDWWCLGRLAAANARV